MQDITYDFLQENELEQVIDLYDEERPIHTNRNKAKEVLDKIKNQSNDVVLTAKIQGEIVGFAKIEIHQDIFEECKPYATIWSVRVKKEYRRNKIGTKLFKEIERLAKQRNCDFMCLMAEKENKIANDFYQSLGYESVNGYFKKL